MTMKGASLVVSKGVASGVVAALDLKIDRTLAS